MRKSWVMVAAACGIAAVVFGVTLLVGPPMADDERGDPADLRPGLPTGGAATDPADADLEGVPVGRSKGGEWLVRHARQAGDADSDDVWTLIRWTASDPKPGGVVDVDRPRTRTYLGRSRVLTMEADAGTFLAPENNPKSGELVGNVVLRIFEGERGREPDLDHDSPDLETVVYLEEASFNLELAQVDSRGPVHLTGREIDFRGRGLSLNHNHLRDRLERLEIREGDVLRFRRHPDEADDATAPGATPEAPPASRRPSQPAAAPPPAAAPQPAPEPAPSTDTEPQTLATEPEPAASEDAAPAPEAAPDEDGNEDQYYRATFERDVRVTTGGAAEDTADVTADTLSAIFSMDGSSRRSGNEGAAAAVPDADAEVPALVATPVPGDEAPSAPARPRRRTASPAAAPADTPAAAPEPMPVSERSMMIARDDDVVVRWVGRLLVEPLERKPRPMAGPDDMLITLQGEPVHVRTGRDETVISPEVTVLTSAGRVEASGSEGSLVRLESPRMGAITGTGLVLNQSLGNGHVRGPGWLQGRVANQGAAVGADPARVDEPAAEELEVAWTDRLDLTFYRSGDAAADSPRPGGLGLGASGELQALRSAAFRGEVMANHPRFHLSGDLVTLSLGEPTDGSNTLQAIEAQGLARMAARGESPDDRFDLAGEHLRITFEPDEQGRPSPRRVAGSGDVVANRPDMRLRTQQLAITLAPEPPSADAPTESESRLAVNRLVASGGVDVLLTEQGVTLTGDRLAGDIGSDRLELFGTPDDPARVIQPEGTLVGQRIAFGERSQTVRVEMPGHLTLASLPGDRRGSLRVDWREAMRYDNQTGLATFTGGVHTTTESPTDRTHLDADALDVRFEHVEPAEPEPEAGAEPAPASADEPGEDAPSSRPQRVRSALAKGDVRFRADRFDEGQPDELVTQFSLRGPEMAFDNTAGAETVRVNGAGRMGILDTRPSDDAAPAAAAAAAPGRGSPAVRVSGRGATLFEWTRRLTMNAAENDITLEGDVRMTHRPAGGGPPVFFDADRVTADLEKSEERTGWLDDQGPQPEIRQINADGRVLIRRDTLEVEADHLVYTEADGKVVLTAEAGGAVQVRRSDLPVPLLGLRIEWNLRDDSFDVREPVGTMAPIRRSPSRRR